MISEIMKKESVISGIPISQHIRRKKDSDVLSFSCSTMVKWLK